MSPECRANAYTERADKSSENVVKLQVLGDETNKLNAKIMTRFNSGDVCYHVLNNLLYSCELSKNVRLRIQKTITFFVCETESHAPR